MGKGGEMKLQKKLTVLLSVSMAVILVLNTGAFAGPTPPVVSGSVATFTGDQSDGIWPASYWSCPPVYTFNVNSLSTNITAAGRAYGIDLTAKGADGTTGADTWSLFGGARGGHGTRGGPGGETSPAVSGPEVNFDGGGYGISMSFPFALGIRTGSHGGDGGVGSTPIWHAIAAYGGNGGEGGLGLPVIVTSDGDIQTNGWLSIGIAAESRGGNGGNGGAASSLVAAYGGHGGAGGNSDVVAVTSDSHIQATGTAAVGIYASSAGGAGGAGGSASSIGYAKGGDGGPGGSGGPVAIQNHGSIVVTGTLPATSEWTGPVTGAIFGQSLGGAGGDGGYGGSVVGLGGGALGSGPGGDVTLDNTGDIQTSGRDVLGIFAQSVGGSAGSAGDAGAVVSWGASPESAGDGGDVLITNSGNIQTLGVESDGLLAQSVGDGGGAGGGSYALVSIGGEGGSNGDGGRVTVENTGDIATVGDGSASIFAQSIGGGGGAVGGHGGTSNSPFFTLGGNGASGGSGKRVAVNNSGNLETSGMASSAILAQSVGGGGGVGGAAYDNGLFFAWSMGGDSTLGGNGGQVDVESGDASIITAGASSHGIHAQSLGGGGGSGGNVYNLILGAAYSGSLAVGGDAGGGGDGSAVNINNGSTITTLGDHAHGLYAQSVGGGGGAGGSATNWTVNIGIPALPDISIAASLGGTGGTGGSGDAVTVSNTGDINTSGFRSYGVFAQSLGGGGGDGGNSMAGDIAINSMGSSIAIGGSGSEGGNGLAVDVDNSGNIATQGDFASGILGQSIGGGGGAGGNSIAMIADIEAIMDLESMLSPDANFKFSLGGTSEGGGHGGNLKVANSGNIDTEGDFANGILAQSIGGGGGAGAETTSIQVELTNNLLDYVPFLSFMSADSDILIGSDGGDGGGGGEVMVTNDGNISTGGNFANGILAQSVGGGGGTAGYIHDDSYRLTSPTSSLTLGSVGGGGGTGGKVEVTNSGHISTEGDFASGILAQSIGGGGGSGGQYEDTTVPADLEPFMPLLEESFVSSKFSIGGSIGVGRHGAEVTVTNDGNISTGGNFANGILAQSVGGGGGTGGYIHADPDGLTDPTSEMVFEGSSGSGGDGGDVTVVNNGDIITDGGFAHGILAQSIGGGGGFGGISEDGGISTLDFDPTASGIFAEDMGFGVGFAGSAGGSGSAGSVDVTHTGSITTHGDMSHGILAQSAAGTDAAGTVTVTLASDITAGGMNSDGIHAQSVGGSGNGDISISIGGGTIQGGSGTGAGVNIDGGANNTLTNAGSISALSGLSIIGGGGHDTVYNNGIVTGSVDLGLGVNAFNNNLTGTFNSGAFVNLGEDNTLTNDGIFSPGGSGSVLDTIIACDFIQSATGHLDIEIGGFNDGEHDFLNITETASLGGNINFSFLPGYDIVTDIGPGETWELSFLTAGDIDSLFNPVFNYNFASLSYFAFDTFQRGNDLVFQATNVVPVPGAFLLGSLGLSLAGLLLRRRRAM